MAALTLKDHDPKVLVKSQVFTALNLLIDKHLGDVQHLGDTIEVRIEHMHKPSGATFVRTRIPAEIGVHQNAQPIAFDPEELKILASNITRYLAAIDAIGELQRYKHRLLDVTGENQKSDQIKVFGEP